jgi:hypothetical protein
MKHIKSLCYISVIASLMTMVFLGSVYGASVTVQREGALQGGQESTVAIDKDDNQLTFAPQRLKNKSDSLIESDTGRQAVKMERYKPYQEGEGESKIK